MSKTSEGTSENALKLLELAGKRFGKLRKAEEKLFRSFADGEVAKYSEKSEKNNDPSDAKDWDKNNRVIRAECIVWLCIATEALAMVTRIGIWIQGARIDGVLDLSDVRISFPLKFIRCAFRRGINLRHAEIRDLNLDGTYTGLIYGNGLTVEDYVFLREGQSWQHLAYR